MSVGKMNERLAKRIADLSASAAAGVDYSSAKREKDRACNRSPTFKPGRIIFSGRNEVPCIIKDMTADGARVILEGEAGLPPVVTLIVTQSASRRRARVAWQKEREAGLSFRDIPA